MLKITRAKKTRFVNCKIVLMSAWPIFQRNLNVPRHVTASDSEKEKQHGGVHSSNSQRGSDWLCLIFYPLLEFDVNNFSK